MAEKHKVTKWLFWVAFGVFLLVSIPHIAWVFHEYARDSNPLIDTLYWVLAYGYALAIDGIMAWLTHVQSSQEKRQSWSSALTWLFTIALVAMSWYLNWVFNLAHDPSGQTANVWTYTLWNNATIGGWQVLSQTTIGTFTPILLSALPLFTIAYVFILNNVSKMKVTQLKSLAMLEQEAQEAELRAVYEGRIREAYRAQGTGTLQKGLVLGKGLIGAARELKHELRGDKQAEAQAKVLQLFRDTPDLLQDEVLAEAVIRRVLRVNKEIAHFLRLKVTQMLEQEALGKEQSEAVLQESGTSVFEVQEPEEREETKTEELHDSSEQTLEYEEALLRNTDALVALPAGMEGAPAGATSNRFQNARYVTFIDAHLMTGYSIDTLKRKAGRGEIQRHPTDTQRLVASSVRDLRNPRRTQN